jgi:RNA polymerase sigma-70 factor (ECF subfamily)
LTSELSSRSRRAPRRGVLEHLARECSESGYRIAYDLLGSAADAEDALQEALAIACRHVGELRNPDAQRAWFHRIVVRHCLRRLRRRKIGRALARLWPGEASDEPEAVIEPGPSAAEQLQQQVDRRRLLAAVCELPTRQRAAVVLRYGHDYSIAEIAELLGIGSGSVKTHLRRGLQALRENHQGDEQ